MICVLYNTGQIILDKKPAIIVKPASLFLLHNTKKLKYIFQFKYLAKSIKIILVSFIFTEFANGLNFDILLILGFYYFICLQISTFLRYYMMLI